MIKIFTSEQIKEIDRYTIDNEPVPSSELMDRAAGKLFEWILNRFERSHRFMIFTGPGNNGGDGLVLARLLWYGGFTTKIFNVRFTEKYSADYLINRKRIEEIREIPLCDIESGNDLPALESDDIVVDAIFGSGLVRPVEGLALETIKHINNSASTVISVDIPSGLFGEDNSRNLPENIIRAYYTLSFQFPRLSFMFADCYKYTGEFHILPIGLHPEAIRNTRTPYHLIGEEDITRVLKTRGKFDHKGNFGHGLLIAGSGQKAGASILSAKAALRTGIGLITCHTPFAVASVIQTVLPEAMIRSDKHNSIITDIPPDEKFNAFGAGPGIGTSDETCEALHKFLERCSKPLVLDADAINILGLHKEWLKLLPAGTILTPHMKEFERIAGETANGYSRLMAQIEFSREFSCIVVLKGAHSSITLPDGRVFFNSTGNPGMATAGSGDVLTGIILSLLAQGYPPADASIAGVYIHGLAGDIAAEKFPFESLIASDIVENIGNAISMIRSKEKSKIKS